MRYAGEPVALVAAETPQLAEDAAELVQIEYEERPGVYDPEAALAPGAPLVHDEGNVLISWHIRHGDVEAALAAAEVVIEGEYRTQHVEHAYLEPEAGVGWIENDVITLRCSMQVIEHVSDVAHILDLPVNKVRLIASYMGGGFGGKEDMTVEPYLGLLVWKCRRPVRMVWNRQESLIASTKRHPFVMRYRTGATSEGKIVAQDVDIIGDAGAYPYLSARILFAGAALACGPYFTPNVNVRSRAVFTNNMPTSAFRGFGAMQVTLGYESQMDRLAECARHRPFRAAPAQLLAQRRRDPDRRDARDHRRGRRDHCAAPGAVSASRARRAGHKGAWDAALPATCSLTGARSGSATGPRPG